MKYSNINLLDTRIEKIIDSTVKHYYSDWKNLDRPKYMKFKGSSSAADKRLILLARQCGTYLIRLSDIKDGDSWSNTLIDYFSKQEKSDYYYIDLLKFECKKIQPESIKKLA